MKQHLTHLIEEALDSLVKQGLLSSSLASIQIEATKDHQHGDFACNIALMLAKSVKQKPQDFAAKIVAAMPASPYVEKIAIAGPGFINFFLSTQSVGEVVKRIHAERNQFGRCAIGRKKRVLVEFVSSNPTGPLHVGHGRHAAFGNIVCHLLDAIGFDVASEYYVNDAGRQIDILTVSVWLRYLNALGESVPFPANAYRGEYVVTIAETIKKEHNASFAVSSQSIFTDLPKDENEGGDKELYIDAVIERAKQLLGAKYQLLLDRGLASILADIENDLTEFGVTFDRWFSEREFIATGVVDALLQKLMLSGHTYELEGATWFRSTNFGDEKDRVLVRSNGVRTYFANDIAYHLSKFERGFDLAVDIFGADHHGYVERMRGAITASGIDSERLIYLLTQFVSLYRSGKPVSMSTRAGDFVTLRELRQEVGNDAARFFYVMRKVNQHIDFDLDLAKSQSNDNPIYYVQYAYARICSVLKQLEARGLQYNEENGLANLHCLEEIHERQLLNLLARYPETIVEAAVHYEPQILTQYLRDVAACFHAYYNAHSFLVEVVSVRDARLALVLALRQVLQNGFEILGIHARESM
ncbi:MAG: arginine--tRNA ligase [Gammaproteobacteria bacterium RIFCSPHIGHO2_12_FULL_42_10]|nr:MAG: arginine--tRNA ligase [Gammaproteobacteria bacterium RIFCSPHIGHO2_12_FULL_42_10]